ncbi:MULTISPECIES: GNAT family N-acetyltransferase [unclassified Mesorhizobium]|uniref:GNAT family N-acetyltransferase n=1 Tax=unclassified Mesorhizobium TaxID=325217 RepID=UPI000FCADCF5|nr:MULTISPECIES: GNAT family N-acetyltransferase [unclassified Mesorhizobium]RUW01130.1 GNAT family N-acetyltransferase [Mesorhizobium sp. M1A.F.Ca.IN.020.04.1.1]RUW13050.1 GNAT family N-acetyltransferase [Mesorhizobium sp. M1A.F.Ca.IN.020.03.1.1]RWF75522.1 MAG: GNAT family N-acetyltransferase [Mesorhizobium sp.]RWG16749.1 MAG: GNAT family N-acetyltransferase [Mesorhizobium sp.]RWG33467.1 MAG: GNAT family N-acetyltransferase [Mesorhizobium sp.]
MRQQSYLIDTNILIGLEDYRAVEAAYAKFSSLASAHKITIFVHEAARDDISRDKNSERCRISLSKIAKYRILGKQRGLSQADLEAEFGPLKRPNDIVDATLLHALKGNAADFLVTQDKGLHERAFNHSAELGRRVLFVVDAVDLLTQTYEPKQVPIRHVAEVEAHTINHKDAFFNSLREGYPEFDDWWREKCVRQHRPCWVVYDDDQLAGLIVRKDETSTDTDAVTKVSKILKICTFKVAPDKRGVKLGELLLKQVLWYAQRNGYDLTYLTTYEDQAALMNLLEFYGFNHAGSKTNGELIYERAFSPAKLIDDPSISVFEAARRNYPRFRVNDQVRGFGIPIKEDYHDTLYPDLWKPRQPDFFVGASRADRPTRPGNTIRKVYLCRAPSNLGDAGSLLFFYKGASKERPSQAMTTLGILESVTLAYSTRELMQLTGGRSVYSEQQLERWQATKAKPVKVINYLLAAYIDPVVGLDELRALGIVNGNPQQSIYEIRRDILPRLLNRANLEFEV